MFSFCNPGDDSQYRSKNKIRSVVAGLDLTHTSSTKSLINLGLGDPTVFGLHTPSEASISAVQEALLSGSANGYVPGTGDKAACAAVARYHSKWDKVEYQAEDVTLVSSIRPTDSPGVTDEPPVLPI